MNPKLWAWMNMPCWEHQRGKVSRRVCPECWKLLKGEKMEELKVLIPNPGSNEAMKKGCLCAVLDNCHGWGSFDFGMGKFWVTESCPLHGKNSTWGRGAQRT